MPSSWKFTAPGSLVVLLALAVTGTAAEDGPRDTPMSRLRVRIADLHAEVAVLKVECKAAKEVFLASLKKTSKLELGNGKAETAAIRKEVKRLRDVVSASQAREPKEIKDLLGKVRGTKGLEDEDRLFAEALKGGEAGEKALDRLTEIEARARLDAARAETGRMRTDYREKCRLLHQKKLELADAEAEYKAAN